MDASSLEAIQHLTGKTKRPLSTITPEAWLYVLDDLYRDLASVRIPDLFRVFSDLEKKVPGKPVMVCTKFARGFGINTTVAAEVFEERKMGDISISDQDNTRVDVLLLKPELTGVKWAIWSFSYTRRRVRDLQGPGTGVDIHTDIDSSAVTWASREQVLEIFSKCPMTAVRLVGKVQMTVQPHIAELSETLGILSCSLTKADGIKARVEYLP